MKTLLFSILLSLNISGCASLLKEAKHQADRNNFFPKVQIEAHATIATTGPGILANSLQIDSLPRGAIVSAFRSPTVDTAKNGTAVILIPPDREVQRVVIRYYGIKSVYYIPTKTAYTTMFFKDGNLFPKELP